MSPAGYWIVVRPEIGKPVWIVRVLNFASFKYVTHEFPDETAARSYADMWRI
jgi:hypothetical protein